MCQEKDINVDRQIVSFLFAGEYVVGEYPPFLFISRGFKRTGVTASFIWTESIFNESLSMTDIDFFGYTIFCDNRYGIC